MNNEGVRIIQTPEFHKTASDFLSDHELSGLLYVLANNALVGKEHHEYPGIFVLDWRGDGAVCITYLVSQQLDEVLLIAIGIEDPKDSEDYGRQTAELRGLLDRLRKTFDFLTKAGIGYALKRLIDKIFGDE